MTLGKFRPNQENGISFREARSKAKVIIGQVEAGRDPNEQKSKPEDVLTVGELADNFLETHCRKLSSETVRTYKQQLNKDVLPRWKVKKPREIGRSDVNEVLDHIAYDRQSPVASDRTRSLLHKLFNFALERGIVKKNPVSGPPKRANESSRDRVLTDSEIKTFWECASKEDIVVQSLFKMVIEPDKPDSRSLRVPVPKSRSTENRSQQHGVPRRRSNDPRKSPEPQIRR